MAKSLNKESALDRGATRRAVAVTKESALDRYVRPEIEKLLTGKVLAIDPSSGSTSQPGYSLFLAGKLQEAGTLEIGAGIPAHERFYALRKTLVDDFETPDVLVIENIAPMMGKFTGQGVLNLHRSIGVILSAFPVPVVWISPIHWQKNIDRTLYQKSDTNDAILLGFTALKHAAHLQNRVCPISEKELHAWVYGDKRDVK